MNKYTHFIGIDVSKDRLDICILKNKTVILESCIKNSPKALITFNKVLHNMDISPENTLCCCEHTGIYTSDLIGWSSEYGYKLWVEKAIQIKRSIGLQRGKNDKIDAYRIAMYAFRYQDKAVIFERPRKVIETLKHLLALRQRLLKIKKQLEVPLGEMQHIVDKSMYKKIIHCSKKTLQGVKNDLIKVDKDIRQMIKQDAELSKTVSFATSVDGVGIVTAISLIVATNAFSSVRSGKQLACYVGVVPFSYRSGSSIRCKERVSHFANKPLKTLLHLCAVSAKTHSQEFRQYYDRKIAEGKHKMSVLNAIRNKIVLRIWACITKQKSYVKLVA